MLPLIARILLILILGSWTALCSKRRSCNQYLPILKAWDRGIVLDHRQLIQLMAWRNITLFVNCRHGCLLLSLDYRIHQGTTHSGSEEHRAMLVCSERRQKKKQARSDLFSEILGRAFRSQSRESDPKSRFFDLVSDILLRLPRTWIWPLVRWTDLLFFPCEININHVCRYLCTRSMEGNVTEPVGFNFEGRCTNRQTATNCISNHFFWSQFPRCNPGVGSQYSSANIF